MPVVVGAVVTILVIVLVGNLIGPFRLGVAEIVVTVFLGLVSGITAGIWEVRRRHH